MLGCSQLEDFSDKLFFFTATKRRQITRPLSTALNPRLLVFYGQGVWHTTEMVYGDIWKVPTKNKINDRNFIIWW